MQMEYHLHELIMMHLIHWIMTDESSIFFEMIDSECAQVGAVYCIAIGQVPVTISHAEDYGC